MPSWFPRKRSSRSRGAKYARRSAQRSCRGIAGRTLLVKNRCWSNQPCRSKNERCAIDGALSLGRSTLIVSPPAVRRGKQHTLGNGGAPLGLIVRMKVDLLVGDF